MSDFCKQCSTEIFGRDIGDLKGLGGKRRLKQWQLDEGFGWKALCEGCGPTLVDDDGRCVGQCFKGHDNA
ncbi:hypothetical protein [Zhongshania sp.]|uniref:hypothetical protein n=1 Tax=Zhongshania sp. TaxID=1971902 RepID=UPI0035680D1B